MIALHLLPERDCARCTPHQQAEWGCHARVEDGRWVNGAILPLKLDGEDAHQCPRRPIKDDQAYFTRLLWFHGLYRQGHLPDSGGVSEQSYRGLTLLQLVDGAVEEVKKEHRDRAARRQARNRR